MKHLKLFENIKPHDTFDNNGKFIFIGESYGKSTFQFVWNIRKIEEEPFIYQADSVGFTYYENFNYVNIHQQNIQQNNLFKFKLSETRIEPDKFYEKFPQVCYKLYYNAKEKIEKIKDSPSFIKMKYEKIINTLYNIKNFQLEIEIDKYNL